MAEASSNPNWPLFVTLTYKNETLPESDEQTRHVLRLFWQTLRNYGMVFRYFVATEKGSLSSRLHHHAVVWANEPEAMALGIYRFWGKQVADDDNPIGKTDVQVARSASGLGYIAKYCSKGAIYQWSRKLGHKAYEGWKRVVTARHEQNPYGSMAEIPCKFNANVLNEFISVRIPQNVFVKTASDLGVPYAPVKNDAESIVRLRFPGVPNGPLDMDFIKGKLRATTEIQAV